MRKLIILLLTTSCIFMAGCAHMLTPYRPPVQQGNIITKDMTSKLKVGMTQQQVADIFGHPVLNDPFHQNTWTYVYTMQPSKGVTQKKMLIIYFKGGNVIGFNQS
jgi:outer membrane protein assembly factor BamE